MSSDRLSSGPTQESLGQDAPTLAQLAQRLESTQTELHRLHSQYHQLFDESPIPLIVLAATGEIVEMNDSTRTTLQVAAPAHFLNYLRPPDQDVFATELAAVLERGEPRLLEVQCCRTDGSSFPGLVHLRPWVVQAGPSAQEPLRGLAALLDITQQKKAHEQELARLKAQARGHDLLDTAVDAILSADDQLRVASYNRRAERLFGYAPAEARELYLDQLLPDGQIADCLETLKRQLRSGVFAPGVVGEMTARRKDGELLQIEANVSLRELDGRLWTLLVLRDRTARKFLEEQLHHAQKMEAVGRLAGGIAHDFNNLLTVINGYSELLLNRYVASDAKEHGLVLEIRKAGERAAALTRQVLSFSRKSILSPSSVLLNNVIQGLEALLAQTVGEKIRWVAQLEPALWRIRADPAQIEQVIVNLVTNARDAMPDGGELLLATDNVTLGVELLHRLPEARPGEYVRLLVRDTGVGMTDTVKQHLFEPFFTTKEVGKGTGLGLASVYGIVKQSEGEILFDSIPGQGTTFQIYFPRLETSPSIAPEQPPAPPTPVAELATILLVEDDRGVRDVARLILQRQGYRILEAGDGRVALDLMQSYQGPLDLLVTDVVMPRMSGHELARRLRDERPDLKVLFLSGYTDDITLRQVIRQHGVPFLQKPFTSESLARKVRELLES